MKRSTVSFTLLVDQADEVQLSSYKSKPFAVGESFPTLELHR